MAKRREGELKVGDRVVSVEALPGVPAGTSGRVILANGIEWKRYRVLFDTGETNGTDVGSMNREQLVRVDRKGRPVEEPVTA